MACKVLRDPARLPLHPEPPPFPLTHSAPALLSAQVSRTPNLSYLQDRPPCVRFLCLVNSFLVFITAPSSFSSWTFIFGITSPLSYFLPHQTVTSVGASTTVFSHCCSSKPGRVPDSELVIVGRDCPLFTKACPSFHSNRIQAAQLEHTSFPHGWLARCPSHHLWSEKGSDVCTSFAQKTSPSPRLVLTTLRAGVWWYP